MREQALMVRDGEEMNVPSEKVQQFKGEGWVEKSRAPIAGFEGSGAAEQVDDTLSPEEKAAAEAAKLEEKILAAIANAKKLIALDKVKEKYPEMSEAALAAWNARAAELAEVKEK